MKHFFIRFFIASFLLFVLGFLNFYNIVTFRDVKSFLNQEIQISKLEKVYTGVFKEEEVATPVFYEKIKVKSITQFNNQYYIFLDSYEIISPVNGIILDKTSNSCLLQGNNGQMYRFEWLDEMKIQIYDKVQEGDLLAFSYEKSFLLTCIYGDLPYEKE